MSTRFECPRCQTVFVDDAADQAFAECPECGSLALPRGETTAEDAFALRESLGATPTAAATSRDAPGGSADTQVGGGIFNALLAGSEGATPPGAFRSVPDGAPVGGAWATDEGPAVSDEGATLAEQQSHPSQDPDATDVALPLSLALTRGDTPGPTAAPSPPPSPSPSPPPSLPPSLALTRAPSLEGAPMGDASGFLDEPTRNVDNAHLLGGGDDEFDPFRGLELPIGRGTAAPPDGGDGPTMEVPTLGSFQDPTAPSGDPSLPPEMDLGSGEADPDRTVVGPAPAGVDVTARAVTLSELERELPAGTPLEMFNPMAGQDLFGDEAFGDLEKAFDQAASRPDIRALSAPPGRPMTAEEALRAASISVDNLVAPQAPRPPESPKAPPLRLRRPDRPPHLSLSPEAMEAAALPILTAEVSGRHAAPSDAFGSVPDRDESLPTHLSEETDVIRQVPVSEPPRARVLGTSAASGEGRAEADDDRAPVKLLEEERGVLGGFTLARVGAAAALFLVVGVGVGAAVAPSPDDKPVTQRDRAEQIFAKGNRFYDEGRFDDALGDYRGALVIDPSFAPAHRAKGAALAKQRRYEEAAAAYEEYLAVSPEAIDAAQVQEVLERYWGKGYRNKRDTAEAPDGEGRADEDGEEGGSGPEGDGRAATGNSEAEPSEGDE